MPLHPPCTPFLGRCRRRSYIQAILSRSSCPGSKGSVRSTAGRPQGDLANEVKRLRRKSGITYTTGHPQQEIPAHWGLKHARSSCVKNFGTYCMYRDLWADAVDTSPKRANTSIRVCTSRRQPLRSAPHTSVSIFGASRRLPYPNSIMISGWSENRPAKARSKGTYLTHLSSLPFWPGVLIFSTSSI